MAKLSGSDLPDRIDPETGMGVWDNKKREFETEELREITSFDEAVAAATDRFGEISDASTEIGSGFDVLDREAKDSLCGVGFIVLEMSFNHGDMGEFVSFTAVTQHNRRVIVNDGSTGIYKQLKAWHDRTGKKGGLFVKGGLRRSDYPATEERPAGTTYYLNV